MVGAVPCPTTVTVAGVRQGQSADGRSSRLALPLASSACQLDPGSPRRSRAAEFSHVSGPSPSCGWHAPRSAAVTGSGRRSTSSNLRVPYRFAAAVSRATGSQSKNAIVRAVSARGLDERR